VYTVHIEVSLESTETSRMSRWRMGVGELYSYLSIYRERSLTGIALQLAFPAKQTSVASFQDVVVVI
jgi:hypothetical protein